MSHDTQLIYEYLNYGLIIVLLILIAVIHRWSRRSRHNEYRKLIPSW